jgi:ubiquinone/menaquinone biosynthesis C-methylase UbiE
LAPKVLKEWYRALNPNGRTIIVVLNFDRLVDWHTLQFTLRRIKIKYIFMKRMFVFKNINSGRGLTDNFIVDIVREAVFL